jgi:hypothetical protein
MRKPPLAVYFLFAWAAYAVFITVATVIWIQIQFEDSSRLDLTAYLDLFVDMALRALPGTALYAAYFLAIRPLMSQLRGSPRVMLNWTAFLLLTSLGFIIFLKLFESAELTSALMWYDLVPILVSASLGMLLYGQMRTVLFGMFRDESETE